MTKEEINKQIQGILKENDLKMAYKLDFPVYRILPEEVRLALAILEKHGMKIQITYQGTK